MKLKINNWQIYALIARFKPISKSTRYFEIRISNRSDPIRSKPKRTKPNRTKSIRFELFDPSTDKCQRRCCCVAGRAQAGCDPWQSDTRRSAWFSAGKFRDRKRYAEWSKRNAWRYNNFFLELFVIVLCSLFSYFSLCKYIDYKFMIRLELDDIMGFEFLTQREKECSLQRHMCSIQLFLLFHSLFPPRFLLVRLNAREMFFLLIISMFIYCTCKLSHPTILCKSAYTHTQT